ncbi:MAG: sulfatase family protein [Promethearchaeota archaeon]
MEGKIKVSSDKPNIIWIFGDQHRAQALGCSGDPNVNTPNIDGLAKNGFMFTQAVAGFPLCCPFRGALMTGMYPHKTVPGHQFQLDPSLPTITKPFKDAGYTTAYFGKWHLDGYKEERGGVDKHVVPPDRRGGFDEWTGYENNNKQWDTWVHGGEGNSAFQYKLPGYETDELTNLLINYIRGTNDRSSKAGNDRGVKPFFAVMSVQPPHNPYFAPEEFMEKHFDLDLFQPRDIAFRENVPDIPHIREQAKRDLAGAYAMIENLDWNVGRILNVLEECGLSENTYVIFFSDHGDMHGSHGHFRKTSPYDESIRIPFIIGGARGMKYSREGGRRLEVLVNHVDIAPTTLGLCGIETPPWMEGKDYSHHVTGDSGGQDEPDSAYLQSVVPTGHHDCIDKPWRGIITDDGWKYVCFENCDWLMFDLNNDPNEMVNLVHYSKYKAKKRELQGRLISWVTKTGDEFEVPRTIQGKSENS